MSDNRNAATPHNTNNALDPLAAKDNTTIAYTDGACKGNPGAGGWGAHLIFNDGRVQDLYGGDNETTNNRMELMGAIQALTHSPHEHMLEIWTDSSYVKNGITDWIEGWKKRGWKTASKKPVANQDLWQQLDELCQKRQVEWHWVKGHAGHAGNEKADELANLGVTSSSEHLPAASTQDGAKKKVNIASDTKLSSHDDWLTFDPLGFDVMDEEYGEENKMQASHDDNLSAHLGEESGGESGDNPSNNIVRSQEAVIDNSHHEHYPSTPPNRTTDTSSITDTPNVSHVSTISESKAQSIMIQTAIPNNENDGDTDTDTPLFDGDTSRANPYFTPLLPKPIYRHESNRQLIMDTETTGLDALKGDRIIEVGIVELVGRKFTGEKLHVYINPQRGMDEEVIRIHGISEAFLADKPTFDQVAQSLYDFMDGAEIIAHNASFDMTFLNMEFAKVGLHDFATRVQVTDSLAMAKQQYPGQKNTLDALVRRLNVGKQDRTFHGALLDSEILAEVYLAMTGGQVTLAIEEDTQAEGGHTAHANFATLAALLLESVTDETANQSWYAALSDDYPALKANL